jgi:hypothetical protein
MSDESRSKPKDTLKPNSRPHIRSVAEIALVPDKKVLKCTAEDGSIVVKKVGERWQLLESEVRMLSHATGGAQIKGPKLREVYLDGKTRVIVTDFDPGVTVHSVW